MRAKTTHRTVVTVLFFTIVLCLLTAGGCKNASKREMCIRDSVCTCPQCTGKCESN